MKLSERSKQVRRDAIKLMTENGGYHYGGSFSCAEILIALYDKVLKNEDVFILSKGHGCWCYYVLLREHGFNPRLEKHPHADPLNGIYATSGSMGHGLPFATGMALAKHIQGIPGHVYVLVSDGELQEGTTWESFLINYKLDLPNITIIVDENGIQASGHINNIMGIQASLFLGHILPSIYVNGHDIDRLTEAINKYKFVIAKTIKGAGISFMQHSVMWGAKKLAGPELSKAIKQLK